MGVRVFFILFSCIIARLPLALTGLVSHNKKKEQNENKRE